MDKFKRERSKSIAYLKNPPEGNLGLYHKKARMIHVNKGRGSNVEAPKKERSQSSQVGEPPKLRKGVSIAQLSTLNNVSYMNTDAMISRYMEVHNNKITELLGYDEKQNVLSKYLRMRNKVGLNYLKPEIEGLHAELDEEKLKLQSLKKQVVRSKEDVVMTKMQNDELRRQIGKVERATHDVQ